MERTCPVLPMTKKALLACWILSSITTPLDKLWVSYTYQHFDWASDW